MAEAADVGDQIYRVVVNEEEQYSIWPEDRELPAGWRDGGVTGSQQACLDHIDEVWTDMRPLSLRRYMEEQDRRAAEEPPQPEEEPEPAAGGETLVQRLARGTHPIEVSLRPERTAAALEEAIEAGYVFLKFTETRGGTEIGVSVDREASDVSGADFERGSGTIHLEGDLSLDFVPVRCIADINVASLTAEGRLGLREHAA